MIKKVSPVPLFAIFCFLFFILLWNLQRPFLRSTQNQPTTAKVVFFESKGEGDGLEPNAKVSTLEASGSGLRGKPWPGILFGKHQWCLPAGSKLNDGMTYLDFRRKFTWPWIRGKVGIEIGALQQPFEIPEATTVTYVDSLTLEQMRAVYPEHEHHNLVTPKIIDKAESLSTIEDGSFDFVLASHVIEHTQLTILAVRNMLRVVKSGGVVVLVVPMKCETFDRQRIVTSWDHFLEEYLQPSKAKVNSFEHYREFAAGIYSNLAGNAVIQDVDERAKELHKQEYPIHFHTWDQQSWLIFLARMQSSLDMPFKIAEWYAHKYETLVVLERTEGDVPAVSEIN
jgi:SAM-dependent methyltransferase